MPTLPLRPLALLLVAAVAGGCAHRDVAFREDRPPSTRFAADAVERFPPPTAALPSPRPTLYVPGTGFTVYDDSDGRYGAIFADEVAALAQSTGRFSTVRRGEQPERYAADNPREAAWRTDPTAEDWVLRTRVDGMSATRGWLPRREVDLRFRVGVTLILEPPGGAGEPLERSLTDRYHGTSDELDFFMVAARPQSRRIGLSPPNQALAGGYAFARLLRETLPEIDQRLSHPPEPAMTRTTGR